MWNLLEWHTTKSTSLNFYMQVYFKYFIFICKNDMSKCGQQQWIDVWMNQNSWKVERFKHKVFDQVFECRLNRAEPPIT